MKKGIGVTLLIVLVFGLCNMVPAYAIDIERSDIIIHLGDNRAYVNNALVYIDPQNKEVMPIIINNRTLVPIRFIAEKYADEVLWDNQSKKATIRSGENQITIAIGSSSLYVNGEERLMDVEAVVIGERTFLPLRAICNALGKHVFYDESGIVVISDSEKTFDGEAVDCFRGIFQRPISYEDATYNGHSMSVIRINPKDPSVKIEVSLPYNQLNKTAKFLDIVNSKDAFAAVNANFFTAYSNVKDPIGNVISDGKVVFGQNGMDGVVIMNNGDVKFINPIIYVKGMTDGKSGNVNLKNGSFIYYKWDAYGINTKEQDVYSALVYTKELGEKVDITCAGYVITVEDEVVKSNVYVDISAEAIIPQNGYVIFIGEENEKDSRSAESLKVGRTVQMSYRIFDFDNENEELDIKDIKCALSGGPVLLKNGNIVDKIPDSFSNDTRFTTAEARRTAIGADKSGNLILLYTSKSTITELKNMMKMIGCVDAINLDGGASSGMYFNGKLIATPGRELATVLYVYYDK